SENSLGDFAEWAVSRGRPETAATLLGALERSEPNLWNVPMVAARWAEIAKPAEAALGRAGFAEALARGRELEAGDLLELVRGFERQVLASDSAWAETATRVESG